MHENFWHPKISGKNWRAHLRYFWVMRLKIFDWKSWHTPFLHKTFHYPKIVKHQKVSVRNFSVLCVKQFSLFSDWKSWYSFPLPPLIHKSFRYWNFSETPKVLRNCKTTSFRQKIATYPSYAQIVLRPEFFWNTEGFLYEISRYYETTSSRRQIVIIPPSPVSSISFFDTRKFLEHIVFIVLPVSCALNVSMYEKFWKTEGFPYEIF